MSPVKEWVLTEQAINELNALKESAGKSQMRLKKFAEKTGEPVTTMAEPASDDGTRSLPVNAVR